MVTREYRQARIAALVLTLASLVLSERWASTGERGWGVAALSVLALAVIMLLWPAELGRKVHEAKRGNPEDR